MTILNGIKLRGDETFTELLEIGKKKNCPQIKNSCNSNSYAFKGRPKKDNSKKGDIFINCRSCDEYIRGDWRSSFDGRYCKNCL